MDWWINAHINAEHNTGTYAYENAIREQERKSYGKAKVSKMQFESDPIPPDNADELV